MNQPLQDQAGRLYPIRSTKPYWLAGPTRDGRQALVALLDQSAFIAVLFGADGGVVTAEEHGRGLDEWLRRTGFEPGTIHVRAFAHGPFLIKDMPQEYRDFLQDPDEVPRTAREKASLQADIEEWRKWGRFILIWGDEFWMEGDGTIFAT